MPSLGFGSSPRPLVKYQSKTYKNVFSSFLGVWCVMHFLFANTAAIRTSPLPQATLDVGILMLIVLCWVAGVGCVFFVAILMDVPRHSRAVPHFSKWSLALVTN